MSIIKNIALLGSTGSIGTQTLDVCRMHGIKPIALCAAKYTALLEKQAREFMPEAVCIYDENRYSDMKQRLSDTDIKVLCGMDGLCEVSSLKTDAVVNSVVGMVGLRPTLAALDAGNKVALANKETLVTGGELVMKKAKEKNLPILPIDSEHSAIFQSLMASGGSGIERILLTASGGPFFGYTKEKLKTVTKKITTDSATLMNKGLELIEAVWLFGVTPEKVEVNVHRQSILHSAVEFEDGSVIGQMGVPDMRIPIQFALTYPERLPSPAKRLSLFDVGTMTFEKADEETFLCLKYAKKMIARGGTACTVLNSANEAAVGLFLEDKIPFYRIGELVADACENVREHKEVTLGNILDSENTAREYVIAHA